MLKLLFGTIGVLAVFMIATATAPSVGAGVDNNHEVTLRIERPASCTADVTLEIDDNQANPPSVSTTTSGNQNITVTARDDDFSVVATADATNCSEDHLRAYLRVDGATLAKAVDNSTELDDPFVELTGNVESGIGPVSIGPAAAPSGDYDVRMRTTADPACNHVAALLIERNGESWSHSKEAAGTHSVRLPASNGDTVTGSAAATTDCPDNARINGNLNVVGGPALGNGFTTLLEGSFTIGGTVNVF